MTGRVVSLGEAMIELVRRPGGPITQGYGGDTLNTAIYLARLGIPVDYVTALGDDPESDAMLAGWHAEGIGTAGVLRAEGRLPGLYMIDVDPNGERRFLYWRDRAPAREMLTLPGADALIGSLHSAALVYFSGISLAIVGETGRLVLDGIVDDLRAAGVIVAFDTNWRPRLWPDRATARRAYEHQLERTDIAFLGGDDMADLFGDRDASAILGHADADRVGETVLRLGADGCLVRHRGETRSVPASRGAAVVDTTAAGDAFSAGYLASRLLGRTAIQAAETGHRVAAVVIGHSGAIIPPGLVTPALLIGEDER